MRYDLSNEFDIAKFKDACAKLLEQGGWVDLHKVQERRTRPQSNYLHLILGWFACEYGSTMEEIKVDVYKRLCNPQTFIRTKYNRFGQAVQYLRSTADLSVEEMSLTIDRFRNYAASVAGIYLPEANEDRFLRHIEREMERNRQFI